MSPQLTPQEYALLSEDDKGLYEKVLLHPKEWIKITEDNLPPDILICSWKHPELGIIHGNIVRYSNHPHDYKESEWIYPSDGSADIWLGEFTHYRKKVRAAFLLKQPPLKTVEVEPKQENEYPESPKPPDYCPNCGSKETKETNIYRCNDADICEYTLKCKACDCFLGHWAYGHWQY